MVCQGWGRYWKLDRRGGQQGWIAPRDLALQLAKDGLMLPGRRPLVAKSRQAIAGWSVEWAPAQVAIAF